MKKWLRTVLLFALIGILILSVTPAKADQLYYTCPFCDSNDEVRIYSNYDFHTYYYANFYPHDLSQAHPHPSAGVPYAHVKSGKSSETPATCTADGLIVWHCDVCYSLFQEITTKLSHAWGLWAHDTGTSGSASRHTHICGNDSSHTETAACAFTGAVTVPTCTEAGFTTHTCAGCGYNYKDAQSIAMGHSWGLWTHDAATTGSASRHQRVCGNDTSHTQTAVCAFTGAVTDPTCTVDGFITNTCAGCGYSNTDTPVNALGHTAVVDKAVPATCTQTGLTESRHCSVCQAALIPQHVIPALGHISGEWEVTLPPTNKKAGLQVKRCTRCGVTLETAKMPVLSETLPDNTACSYGLRFRDEASDLTDKWYMYTPVDLTIEGTLDVPLIASNRYRIGTAQVTIKQGQVSATYTITADMVQVKQEFIAFLPGLDGLETVEPEALESLNVPLGTPVDIASLGGSQALFFMRLVVTYDIYADGVQWWSMP